MKSCLQLTASSQRLSIQGVTDVLEQKAVGTVTTQGLKEMLERVLRESGVEELVQRVRAMVAHWGD
jgi:hypothetical protein